MMVYRCAISIKYWARFNNNLSRPFPRSQKFTERSPGLHIAARHLLIAGADKFKRLGTTVEIILGFCTNRVFALILLRLTFN